MEMRIFFIFDNMKLINELNMIVNLNFFVFFKVENEVICCYWFNVLFINYKML